MIWRDNLRIAVGGATSNKLRSLLTMLGVLIGVAAVIILVAVEPDRPSRFRTTSTSSGRTPSPFSLRGRFGGRATTGTQSTGRNDHPGRGAGHPGPFSSARGGIGLAGGVDVGDRDLRRSNRHQRNRHRQHSFLPHRQ